MKKSEAKVKAAEEARKAAEAEAKTAEAEKRVSEAVLVFRQSPAFDEEIVRSTSQAYNLGFQDCKLKVKRTYNLEGIEEVEPDVPEDVPSSPSEDTAPPE